MSDEKYLVVRQSFNWADEIDFSGYFILPEKAWIDALAFFQTDTFYPKKIQLGTNQEHEFYSFEDYRSTFNVISRIDKAEYDMLAATFCKEHEKDKGFRLGDTIDLREYYEDEEEDEDLYI